MQHSHHSEAQFRAQLGEHSKKRARGVIPWRSSAEQLTHRLVLRRRLPPPFDAARIYTTSEGGLRYLKLALTAVDPPLLNLVAELVKPGSVVWDIGANLGLFSFASAAMAGPTGHVIAVEPDCWLVGLLRRSAALNRHLAQVDVLPVGVSDAIGVGRLHIARRNRATNFIEGYGTTQTGGSRSTELIPMVTLDWLTAHFPRPDILKIDVEAAEVLLLRGAHTVLGSHPTIICEVAGQNAAGVRELLQPYDYLLYDGDLPASARTPLDEAPAALLAVPRANSRRASSA